MINSFLKTFQLGENMLVAHDFSTRNNIMYALINHSNREKDKEDTFAILSLITITGAYGNRFLQISHIRVKTKLLPHRLPTRLLVDLCGVCGTQSP